MMRESLGLDALVEHGTSPPAVVESAFIKAGNGVNGRD